MARKKKRNDSTTIRYYDYSLIAILMFLVCFGLVMLYSTSAYSALTTYRDSMYYFKRQLVFCAFGFFVVYVVSRIDYHWYIKCAKLLYIVSLFLMALVQTPLGKEVNGARRWIRLPAGQQFQPAEVAKIAVILFIAVLLCKAGKEAHSLRGIWKVLRWGGLSSACVLFLTDNLSTAVIVFGITCIMIFVVHPKTAPFVVLLTAGMSVILIAVQVIGANLATSDNFRLRRIIVWLNPEEHAADGAFQILQGLYAIRRFFREGTGKQRSEENYPGSAKRYDPFCYLRRAGGIWSHCCAYLVCNAFVPAFVYRAECTGSLRLSCGDGDFCTYCDSGYFECSSCDEYDTKYRNHPAICQLWRNIHFVSDGGDGNCAWSIQKNKI